MKINIKNLSNPKIIINRFINIVLIISLSFSTILQANNEVVSKENNNLIYSLPDNTEVKSIVVKFLEGTGIRFRKNKFTYNIDSNSSFVNRQIVVENSLSQIELLTSINNMHVSRTFSAFPEEELNAQTDTLEAQTSQNLADLNLYYNLKLISASKYSEIKPILNELNQLEIVQIAYAETLPVLAKIQQNFKIGNADIKGSTPTPLLEGEQGYLDTAPNGIDAHYAWSIYSTPGLGVKIIDIEGAWNTTHEDFPSLFYNSGEHLGVGWENHGTSVMGVMGALDNTFGVTGIANHADFGVQVFNADGMGGNTGNTATSILTAASHLSVGDIILIELQIAGIEGGSTCFGEPRYLPVEYNQAEFDAIRQVTLSGKIVVEAAGNGNVNLDSSIYNNYFNRNFRDSGAILVGASKSNARERLCFSNYGSRIDVNAWGENVATLGKWFNSAGILFNGLEEDRWYRNDFNGTSSASPIITGAAAVIQSISDSIGSPRLNSTAMRSLLSSTGTPQALGETEYIGSQPDLEAAIASLVTPDLIPTINILTPFNGEVIAPTGSFVLSADANDDNGINNVHWVVTKDGQTVLSANGSGTNFALSTNVFSIQGDYNITATATDTIGQTSNDTNFLTVEDLFPTINILTPLDGSIIPRANSFTLTADANDDVGVIGVNWVVSKNGVVVLNAAGVGANYSLVTNVFDTVGLYNIVATVEDTVGQSTIASHSIEVKNKVSMNISIENRTHTGIHGKIPNVTVSVSNSGPDVAHNIIFELSVRSNNGWANISNLPQECMLVNSGVNFKFYQCTIPTLASNNKPFEIRWDELCPGRYIGDPSLKFSVDIISLDEYNLNEINSANYSYWYPICTGP